MANGKRKYVWLAAAGALLATLVVCWSMFWPPIPRDGVQGAIGKREVFRQAQLTDQDVGVAGQAKVTSDDVRKFLQSKEFLALGKDANFQNALASGELLKMFHGGVLASSAAQFNWPVTNDNAPVLKVLAANQDVMKLAQQGQLNQLANLAVAAKFGILAMDSGGSPK